MIWIVCWFVIFLFVFFRRLGMISNRLKSSLRGEAAHPIISEGMKQVEQYETRDKPTGNH